MPLANVSVKHLTKMFGDVFAVKDLTLDIENGEFLVLLGPSGCGKTTTLRCIAGLEMPDEGDIYIGNVRANDFSPKDRNVAMVFQSYALYPHMTVSDNMAFPLKMRKVSKDIIGEKIRHIAELLRITHLLKRKPKQLSGGEAQRTALGRAIIRDPEVFLMDEPLSNLDAKLRVHMRTELKRLQKDLGVTTIYVTHDQVEAMTMAERIAILHNGELQQRDRPEEIYMHPSNTFVAGFIGSPPMNFLGCSLEEHEGVCSIDAGICSIPIDADIAEIVKDKASTSELILGFRPEDIAISRDLTSKNLLVGEVFVTEPLGSEIIVDVDVGGELIKAKVDNDFSVSIRDKVGVKINMKGIHIFDKKTTKAVI
jgi:multiple sugar transport system ATP-binding protein